MRLANNQKVTTEIWLTESIENLTFTGYIESKIVCKLLDMLEQIDGRTRITKTASIVESNNRKEAVESHDHALN